MADNSIATSANGDHAARFDSLKSVVRTPAARQLLMLVGIAAAVAIGVAVVLWSRSPNYGLLYGNLGQKDAASITQILQAGGTPYKLSGDGSSIMVPNDQLAHLRLKLAAQGLPKGSSQASSLGDPNSPFGMSDLAERTHYQQMLESDLANTIDSLDSIKASRIHLALPKPSAFIRDNSPASASVVVELYPGRQLGASQVAAIVHLVAASVPALDPRQVSVIDQQGQLLTTNDPDSPAAQGDTQLRLTNRIEDNYASRVEHLLTPLVGAGKVHAQVYADVDFTHSEQAQETYGPKQGMLRSEQVSQSSRPAGSTQANIPGALSNQPPGTTSQPTAANPAGGPGNVSGNAVAKNGKSSQSKTSGTPEQTSSSATRNYELNRTIAHVVNPAGRVSRLTVAVVVDDKQVAGKDGKIQSVPFSKQELARMTDLTKNAVGFDAKRGDSVSVINEAFQHAPDAAMPSSMPFWQRPGFGSWVKQGLGVLLVLALVFGLLRPAMRGLMRGGDDDAPRALPASATATRESESVDVAPAAHALAYEQQISLAKRMAAENPKQVAQVVKNWVAADGA